MKRALVTGASSGIGKAIYEWLDASEDEERQMLNVTGASRRGPDIKVNFLVALPSTSPLFRLPPQDVVILNHGILSFSDSDAYGGINQINLISYYCLLEGLKINDGATVILNASTSGITGEADIPMYAATKAAVINLTKSYAKRWVSRGITVNCFSCGFFNTNLTGGGPVPDGLVQTIPMKRVAEPAEILPVIDLFLTCRYLTGQNIVVDGGLTL